MPDAVATSPPSPPLPAPAPPPSLVEIKPAEPQSPPPALARPRLVWAVIPCFNRPADLALVLADLARLDLAINSTTSPHPAILLRVLVVDNASATPLLNVPVPAGLDTTFLRLRDNTGGSGGYNAGMAWVLGPHRPGPEPDFLWLVDSDVRLDPAALRALAQALDARPDAVAAGSAIADMRHGQVYEVGGRIEPFFGQFGPRFGPRFTPRRPVPAGPIECTYTAACCALVRPEAIRPTGLFPDVFLNGDDVEWFIRMARTTGKKVLAVPGSVVRHPYFGRYATLPRYYMARNAFGPLGAVGAGPRLRLARALREIPRALTQVMVGRDDLAQLHLKGLEHAAAGVHGPAPAGTLDFERPASFDTLASALAPHMPAGRAATVYLDPTLILQEDKAAALERQLAAINIHLAIPCGDAEFVPEPMLRGLAGALWRLALRGPRADIALIHARGRPRAWARGRAQVLISSDGFVVRPFNRRQVLSRACRAAARGLRLALGLARSAPHRPSLPTVSQVARSLDHLVESTHTTNTAVPSGVAPHA